MYGILQAVSMRYATTISGKTMADKLLYINNDDLKNYRFCRLQLVIESLDTYKPPCQNLIKVPKVVKQTNKKTL